MDVEQVADRDRDGKPLRTVLCRDCGLVWTDPRPDAGEVRDFYAEDYREAYKAAKVPKPKHVVREARRAMRRFERIRDRLTSGCRVLDVGAGAGFFPYVLQKHGFDVQGIEPNKAYGAWGREVFGVRVESGFLEDFDFRDAPFDLITINHVLEHLPDPGAALARLRSWMTAEGLLVVEVPNIESTLHSPGNRFHIGHLYNFNPDNLLRLARFHGLEAVDVLLQPGTRHINVIFRRCEPEPAWMDRRLPYNSDRVSGFLRDHGTMAHFAQWATYRRAFGKWLGYAGEWLATRHASSPRELADREIERLSAGRRAAATELGAAGWFGDLLGESREAMLGLQSAVEALAPILPLVA